MMCKIYKLTIKVLEDKIHSASISLGYICVHRSLIWHMFLSALLIVINVNHFDINLDERHYSEVISLYIVQ